MPKHVWGVNYAYQKSVSYSQYSIYKQCQYQWYLNYVKKLKIFKPSVYLTFGTACHETIQEWLRVMYEESAKKAEEMDLGELLKERMYENYKESLEEQKGEHFIKPEEFKDFIQDGVTILDFLKKKRSEYFNLKTTKLIGIEIPIEQYIVDEIGSERASGEHAELSICEIPDGCEYSIHEYDGTEYIDSTWIEITLDELKNGLSK